MVKIKPFCGYHFNKDKVELSEVVAPPYDIISDELQDELYKKNDYNIVRLTLGKMYDTDTENNNRYTRSAKYLNEWIKKGILVRDTKPCLYIYEEEYTVRDTKKTMLGFIGLLKLEDYGTGKIMRHEKTLSKPKEDRLKLMLATNTHLEQIFLLFSDDSGKIDEILTKVKRTEPEYTVKYDNVIHRLWRLDNEDDIHMITKMMKNKPLFIADGHHRYETGLKYRDIMREKHSGENTEKYSYIMAQFNNMDDRLTIFPTYRLVYNLDNFRHHEFIDKCKRYFDVNEIYLNDKNKSNTIITSIESKRDKYKKVFGVYTNGKAYILGLHSFEFTDTLGTGSLTLRRLDVSVLHNLIISDILGINNVEQHIKYTKDADEAIISVDKGISQCALFLNPTTLSELKQISMNNENMPQKSTYFYPKQITGLVLNVINTKMV